MAVKLVVMSPRAGRIELDLCDTEEQFKRITVLQLKVKIAERLYGPDTPGDCLRLFFGNKRLDNDSALLSAYGVQHMSVILAVLHLTGGSFEPGEGDGGMGDKGGKNRSREMLFSF